MLVVLMISQYNVFAGWVITEKSKDAFGNTNIQTTFIEGNHIRHETVSSLAIIDLAKKEITIIFSQYRVYWKGSISDLKKSTVEAYDKQMEELVAGLPKSVTNELDSIYLSIREQMLDTTLQFNDTSIDVEETNVFDTILGYQCKKYNIIVDSIISESIWHTGDVKPYSEINIKNMIAFMKQMKSISGGDVSHSTKYIDLLKDGLLLKSMEYVDDTVFQTVEVTNIREVSIPPDFFSPPQGYRETSFSDILNLMPVITDEMNDINVY